MLRRCKNASACYCTSNGGDLQDIAADGDKHVVRINKKQSVSRCCDSGPES